MKLTVNETSRTQDASVYCGKTFELVLVQAANEKYNFNMYECLVGKTTFKFCQYLSDNTWPVRRNNNTRCTWLRDVTVSH